MTWRLKSYIFPEEDAALLCTLLLEGGHTNMRLLYSTTSLALGASAHFLIHTVLQKCIDNQIQSRTSKACLLATTGWAKKSGPGSGQPQFLTFRHFHSKILKCVISASFWRILGLFSPILSDRWLKMQRIARADFARSTAI